jgi:VanZ family protein
VTVSVPRHSNVDSGPSPRAAQDHWRWLVVVGYMGVIFLLSAQSKLPELPGQFPGIPNDKLAHLLAYAMMSLLVVWAVTVGQWRSVTWRAVMVAIVISSAYGYSDEWHQRFVPNRSYDLWDWAADTTGAVLAALLAWAWSILLLGRRRTDGV